MSVHLAASWFILRVHSRKEITFLIRILTKMKSWTTYLIYNAGGGDAIATKVYSISTTTSSTSSSSDVYKIRFLQLWLQCCFGIGMTPVWDNVSPCLSIGPPWCDSGWRVLFTEGEYQLGNNNNNIRCINRNNKCIVTLIYDVIFYICDGNGVKGNICSYLGYHLNLNKYTYLHKVV